MNKKKLRVGIICERKQPADTRVAITPQDASALMRAHTNLEIVAESSPDRTFTDDDYTAAGVLVVEDASDCDVLFAVKEVPIENLIPNKTYFFFSHTIKKQSYNQKLLQAIVTKNIQLVDYECLVWPKGHKNAPGRMIGFGFWAGVVGTYNAMLTWGRKHRSFTLKPAFQCADYDELKQEIKKAKLPNIKIALTGSGRVAQGANDLLTHMELHEVSVQEIVDASFDEPVFANFDNHHLFARKDGADWDRMHFYNNHGEYDGIFEPYLQHVDLLINGMYWEGSLPPLFSKEDTKINNFKPSVIADITCDVEGSVPITMRATSIQNPTLGWDRISQQEVAPFGRDTIEVMAVTNLPTELPHDASVDFSSVLSKEIIPQLLNNDELGVIDRASITKAGKLNRFYAYLQDYLDGEE